MTAPVRLVFLGGLGEIGRNCFCLEIGGRILVVDCGMMFPTEDMPGVDAVLPDLSYLRDRAEAVEAVVLTHSHEDHIGALPFLLRDLSVPVYGRSLAIGMVKGKLEEAEVLGNTTLVEMGDNDRVEIGPFEFETIPVTHSTPQAVALAFHTPQGVIVHTGDFKLDQTPIDGRLTDLATLGHLGRRGVRLLLQDSTNAESDSLTGSERKVGVWLEDLFARHDDRRIVVASFASHLHRVQQICDAALLFDRKIAFLGRSMLSNTALARDLDILDVPSESIVDISEIDGLPPHRVCVVCTGSQGEPLAALSLMASGDHRHISIGSGDTVIISAKPIPGNEMNVTRGINGLLRSGAEVVHSGVADIHVSGHASARELEFVLGLVSPEHFIPVHGEYRHLVAHRNLAIGVGIPPERVRVAQNGDAVELGEDGLVLHRDAAPGGYVYVDGQGVGDIGHGVLRDRRALAGDGVVICVVGVDAHSGKVVLGPEVLSRGFVTDDEHAAFEAEAARRVVDSIGDAAGHDALDLTTLQRHVRQTIARCAKQLLRRRPMVVPVVVEV